MDKSLLVNLHLWGFALVTHTQALPHYTNKVVFPSVNMVHSFTVSAWCRVGGGRTVWYFSKRLNCLMRTPTNLKNIYEYCITVPREFFQGYSSQHAPNIKWANQNSKQIYVSGLNVGTRVSELVRIMIGWKGGERFSPTTRSYMYR